MDRDVDVLIVGGGPAGLAAGIVCARRGLHTLVCEKRAWPVDKACGEGLMPTGLVHLERLGVRQHIRSRNYFPFEGIRYFSAKGQSVAASFSEGPGWGIPRLELSRTLLERASELDCLELHPEVRALPLHLEKHERLHVSVGNDRIGTRLLVGADGLNSAVRRWAGLQGPKGTQQRWGARQHFRIAPWSRYVEVYWSDGLEAYVTPCGEDQVGVAFLWDRRRHPHLPGGERLIPALLRAFPLLSERLRDAPVSDDVLAAGPLQRNVIRPVSEGLLLIGDAAGYLDALTGEGLSLAFGQALALEETVVPLLLPPGQRELVPREALLAYEKAHRAILRPYYQVTRLALWLSHHPGLAEQVIALLARRPVLFQSLLSANLGSIPLWQVPLH